MIHYIHEIRHLDSKVSFLWKKVFSYTPGETKRIRFHNWEAVLDKRGRWTAWMTMCVYCSLVDIIFEYKDTKKKV